LSDIEFSALASQLEAQGVSIPDGIERTLSGGFGSCFIGTEKVLKLHILYGPNDNLFVGNLPENPEEFFHQSNRALLNLNKAGNAFAANGINVPTLIPSKYGLLSSPIEFGNKTFHAHQCMTRVPGQPMADLPWYIPEDNPAVNVQLGKLARIGAKIHTVMGLASGTPDLRRSLAWIGKSNLDPTDKILLTNLEQDIQQHHAENPAPLVWLHNDFSPQNALESDRGDGVIDWDLQAPGVAEEDLWALAFHPKHTEEFCDQYNRTAERVDSNHTTLHHNALI